MRNPHNHNLWKYVRTLLLMGMLSSVVGCDKDIEIYNNTVKYLKSLQETAVKSPKSPYQDMLNYSIDKAIQEIEMKKIGDLRKPQIVFSAFGYENKLDMNNNKYMLGIMWLEMDYSVSGVYLHKKGKDILPLDNIVVWNEDKIKTLKNTWGESMIRDYNITIDTNVPGVSGVENPNQIIQYIGNGEDVNIGLIDGVGIKYNEIPLFVVVRSK